MTDYHLPGSPERHSSAIAAWIRLEQQTHAAIVNGAQPVAAAARSNVLSYESDDWHLLSRCLDAPTEMFFLDDEESADDAVELCQKCVVRHECLSSALNRGEEGIWGGTSERDRHTLRRLGVEIRWDVKRNLGSTDDEIYTIVVLEELPDWARKDPSWLVELLKENGAAALTEPEVSATVEIKRARFRWVGAACRMANLLEVDLATLLLLSPTVVYFDFQHPYGRWTSRSPGMGAPDFRFRPGVESSPSDLVLEDTEPVQAASGTAERGAPVTSKRSSLNSLKA